MMEPLLPPPSDSESSDSSTSRSKLPPIKKNAMIGRKLNSDTRSKLSSDSLVKTARVPKKKGRESDNEMYADSDGTLTLEGLKRKRNLHVKSLAKLPKNKVERRAWKDLEKIKKKKKKKEYIKKYETQQQRIKEEREKIILKNEIERRKLVLGVQSTNEYMDGFKQIIFDMGDPEVIRYEKWMSQIKKDIELFDFDEEEYRDREGVVLYIKKYSKLMKFLFSKYANSGYSLKDVSNFDNISKKAATINVAELGKLLKDHGVDVKDLTKQEWGRLVQLVSIQMMKRSELHVLDYNGFIQFILQVAHLLYTREPHDYSHLPPVEHIKELIKRFRNAAKARGESTLLYEDPDITFVIDKDVLRELNYKVLENPNYPLPDGYFKVQDKEMKLYYELPEYYEITEGEKIWIELLDDVILNIFGFHFLEPIARFETVTKVKPSFK